MRLIENTALFFYDLLRNNAAISCSWAWSSIVIPSCRPSRFNNKKTPKLIRSLFLALSIITLFICCYGDTADSYYFEQRAIAEQKEDIFVNTEIERQKQTMRGLEYLKSQLLLTVQATESKPEITVQSMQEKQPNSTSTDRDTVLVEKVCAATQEYINNCMGMLNRPTYRHCQRGNS